MAIRNAESFDGILMDMARQHDGVQNLLGTIFSFFARKSDFYTGVSSTTAQKLLLEIYSTYETAALETKEKKKEFESKARGETDCLKEQEHFNPKQSTAEIQESTIQELANKIAENFQGELDLKSKLKTPSTNEPFNKNNHQDFEEDKDELQMLPNSGNGCDSFYRCWTRNVSEFQEFKNDDSFSPNTSMNEPVGKNKNPLLLSLVVKCVFKFLNVENIRNCRFVCREWGKAGKLALCRRASIRFHQLEPFRRPVDFQVCLLNSASLFSSYEFSQCALKNNTENSPWKVKELTKFFEEHQKNIRELSLTLQSSGANIVKNFDITPWISKSPLVQKDVKHMTKLSIDCYKRNLLDIPLHLLEHIKEITLKDCRVVLEKGIRMCPIKLKLTWVTFLEDGIEMDRVRINDIVNFCKAKEVDLTFGAPTKCVLDLKGTITLDILYLEKCEIVNKETSQWVIQHLAITLFPYSLNSQMKIKELSLTVAEDADDDDSLDLFNLPNSIQKLRLADTRFDFSQPIVLQNLQYLAIEFLGPVIDYSFLSLFVNCPKLTHLKIPSIYDNDTEMRSQWIPNSVKTLTLENLMNWTEDSYLILDKLIFIKWPSSDEATKLCEGKIIFQVEDLIIHPEEWGKGDFAVFMEYRKRFTFWKRIYTGGGIAEVEKTMEFGNSVWKEHVDDISSCYYVFEDGQKGRGISKETFLELIPDHLLR